MALMPGVASLEAFQRAVDEFDISSCRLSIDPAALAAARQSVDQSGLLLLGEVHGVRQNPLLARALMVALDVTGLALEWPAALASAVGGFLGDGQVPDHPQAVGPAFSPRRVTPRATGSEVRRCTRCECHRPGRAPGQGGPPVPGGQDGVPHE